MLTRTFLRLVAGLILSAATTQATIPRFVRPDYQNLTGPGTVSGRDPNPGLIWMQGQIRPATNAPSDGAALLTEASFGQPFSPYVFPSISDPSNTYGAQIVAQVRSVLYPPRGSTRTNVLNSTAAFRYKWLLFSPNPGETDVTTHFQDMGNWFGNPERSLVNQQILVLRDAIAISPLDTGLRDLLLDCYYDLAVAEMQFAKQSLASLAAKHLGLTLTSPFVIDEEISIYESLVTLETNVLAKYSELLSMTVEGVDPADFDDREQPGKPMGLYIFLRQQPYRNATATEYATDTGTEVIPDYDELTESPMPRLPENLVLFSGYKDYVTLLQVMGQYTQHQAELARLRGMRQSPNDLVKARNAISKILSETATDFLLLRRVFTNEFFPGDASGVNAAINGVETALADITNVRSFINGTANLLGLDPNFLLLVQSTAAYTNDSFDILYAKLKGPNQPLGDALAKLAEATAKYQTFRASVDQVVKELSDVDSTYQERYVQITGYAVDEVPGFDGLHGKISSGSELNLVEQSIASLVERSKTLKSLASEIATNFAGALRGVNLATNLNGEIEAARQIYVNKATKAYDAMSWQAGLAAAGQATFDFAAALAGAGSLPTDLGSRLGLVAAGASHIALQGTTAGLTVARQKDVDLAAIAFESAQQQQDNALTINQAKQELGAILREQHANTLELTDNALALAQAQAQRTALLGEVQRIAANREGDSATVRKSYYADPIHFVRSENALILADSAFRNAQRWVFYTQRALEYKWQQRFARSESSAQGIRSYDAGSLFKLRNAAELDDLLTQLKGWNDDRDLSDTEYNPTTFISMLNDVLAPNPNVVNLTPAKRTDPGVRVDLPTGDTVSQLALFHRKLSRGMDASGNINIDFDTTQLQNLQANFFVGPDYTTSPLSPGWWRDVIVYLKVNIIAEDGDPSTLDDKGCTLTYGGQTFFRTHIPPCPDRSVVSNSLEAPGEFVTAPFRYYNSPHYNNAYVSQDARTFGLFPAAYTGATARGNDGTETIGLNYRMDAFNQYSVAATRWRLTLVAPPTGWDISKLKDIELIVRHRSHARFSPICN